MITINTTFNRIDEIKTYTYTEDNELILSSTYKLASYSEFSELDELNEYGWKFLIHKLRSSRVDALSLLSETGLEDFKSSELIKLSNNLFPTVSKDSQNNNNKFFGSVVFGNQQLTMINITETNIAKVEFYDTEKAFDSDIPVIVATFDKDSYEYSKYKIFWYVISDNKVSDINLSLYSIQKDDNPYRNLEKSLVDKNNLSKTDNIEEKLGFLFEKASNTLLARNSISISDLSILKKRKVSKFWRDYILYEEGQEVFTKGTATNDLITWIALQKNIGKDPRYSDCWIQKTTYNNYTGIAISPVSVEKIDGRVVNSANCISYLYPNNFHLRTNRNEENTINLKPANGYILFRIGSKNVDEYGPENLEVFNYYLKKQDQVTFTINTSTILKDKKSSTFEIEFEKPLKTIRYVVIKDGIRSSPQVAFSDVPIGFKGSISVDVSTTIPHHGSTPSFINSIWRELTFTGYPTVVENISSKSIGTIKSRVPLDVEASTNYKNCTYYIDCSLSTVYLELLSYDNFYVSATQSRFIDSKAKIIAVPINSKVEGLKLMDESGNSIISYGSLDPGRIVSGNYTVEVLPGASAYTIEVVSSSQVEIKIDKFENLYNARLNFLGETELYPFKKHIDKNIAEVPHFTVCFMPGQTTLSIYDSEHEIEIESTDNFAENSWYRIEKLKSENTEEGIEVDYRVIFKRSDELTEDIDYNFVIS